MTTLPEIQALLLEGMERLGVSFPVKVSWNSRLKTCMGVALLFSDQIHLCPSLWPLATEAQRRETVLHELCHLVATKQYGHRAGHKEPWKKLMCRLGLVPNRLHTVPVPPRKGTYMFSCSCPDKVHYVGKLKAERRLLPQVSLFTCLLCKSSIQLVGQVSDSRC